MKVTANGLQIEVEDSGGEGRPAVLLVMGLGMQLTGWPDGFVAALVDAGWRVLRHDNRDIGLSQGFDHARAGNLVWQAVRHRMGLPVRSAYSLQDMADDALGVLDALGIARAHVIGASMGGMIAQRMAAHAPQRIASLVSIMSSSGARRLPGPRADIGAALLRRPASRTEAALVAHHLGLLRLVQGSTFREDEQAASERIRHALRRAYRPAGTARQMVAVMADSRRAELLGRIASPALVLHGEADPLVPIACGRDVAERIPGARFVPIPGMGHDLPPPVVDLLMQHILPFLAHAESPP